MEATTRFDRVNLIADPLYGYVEITKGRGDEPGERALLDTPWLQRLRRIHQLQSAWWVFPSAEHSRFSHLIGAMHLATLFARRIDASLRNAFPDAPSPACVEETLRLAGLLHDAGHGPFGHFFDREVLAHHGIDHEVVGRHLVENQLAPIIAALRQSPSDRFAAGEQVDPRWVSWVMAPADIPGYDPPGWLRACKPLLCGPATVDNLDYVARDAYMCGVAVGPVDVQRLVHYSFVADGTVVLHAHAAAALQMFLEARLFLYLNIYFHRTVRRIDLSMREIFAPTCALLLHGDPLQHLDDEYLRLTDWSLLEAVERWRTAEEGSEERRLADAWARITARQLPWKLAYETTARGDVDVATVRQRIASALGEGGTGFEVDVASASLVSQNPMADDGLVAIFDPLQRTVEHSRARALVARLPQQSQLVRVFGNDESTLPALHAAARAVLG